MEEKQKVEKNRIVMGRGLLGQLLYELWQENFKQHIELLQIDLSKKLAPDIVSRLISLNHIRYGNRTDIEIALVSS